MTDQSDQSDQSAEEHTVPQHRVRVLMADGSTFVVRILNRDRVLWDKTAPRKKWGSAQDVPFLASTFLAWAAARREEQTSLNFDQFVEAADDVADVDEDEEDVARPTQRAAGPGSA